ncbi:MAG: hypothetical protein AAB131_01045 [Actinomycetota bacterium]
MPSPQATSKSAPPLIINISRLDQVPVADLIVSTSSSRPHRLDLIVVGIVGIVSLSFLAAPGGAAQQRLVGPHDGRSMWRWCGGLVQEIHSSTDVPPASLALTSNKRVRRRQVPH